MIQNPFANMTPVVKNLLIINIIFFIPTMLFDHGPGNSPIADNLGIYYFNSPHFRLWQIVSYMFVHGGIWHIFFNMFALVSFGPIVEYAVGPKRFLSYYFICGIGAIVLQMLVQAFEVQAITGHVINPDINSLTVGLDDTYLRYGQLAGSKLYGIYNGPMVGASGAIFGVLIAFGMLYPNLELMIIPIPVPVKAKYLVPGYVVLELFLGVYQQSGDSVAHFAHLGGALIGFIVIKLWGIRRTNNFF